MSEVDLEGPDCVLDELDEAMLDDVINFNY
jgi:hypothetical protein